MFELFKEFFFLFLILLRILIILNVIGFMRYVISYYYSYLFYFYRWVLFWMDMINLIVISLVKLIVRFWLNMNVLCDFLSFIIIFSLFLCLFVDRYIVCIMIDWWMMVIESGYLIFYVRWVNFIWVWSLISCLNDLILIMMVVWSRMI